MIGYTVEIIGLERAMSGLASIESSFTRLSPLMELFGKEFYSQETSLFDKAPWAPLTPETEARKARLYGGPSRILVATGTLLGSLTKQGAEGNIHDVRDDGAVFGSGVHYGIFHVPTRNPMAEPDEARYNTIAGEYAAETLREAGFE